MTASAFDPLRSTHTTVLDARIERAYAEGRSPLSAAFALCRFYGDARGERLR